MKKITNLQKLLLDEVFWTKYRYSTMDMYRLARFREYRAKNKIPSRKLLESWIREDYKFLTEDTREDKEIMLWLLSIVP